MIVPAKVEEKIRYLIRKFPNTEWSGVLFYSHAGGFETNDLVITCGDLYPMDLGTTGFTEFKMTEDVVSYMGENIELFDYQMGLIHSHHTMGAFFSGQDTSTLQLEGSDTNCFVSLIVDTKGTYQAAITRKVQTKSEVTIKGLGTSYEFFGDGSVSISQDNNEAKKQIVEKEFIEYFMLNVEREEVINHLGYLDTRFEEIENKKKETNKVVFPKFNLLHEEPDYESPWNTKSNKETYKQTALFEEKEPLDPLAAEPDEELIDDAIAHMLLLSLSCPTNTFNIKQFVEKKMKDLYDRVFSDMEMEALTGVGQFELWCDFVIDYYVMNFNDPSLPLEIAEDIDEYYKVVALTMYRKLEPYQDSNDYINGYLEALSRYCK